MAMTQAEHSRRYRERHPEKVAAARESFYEKNQAYREQYYREHREEYARRYKEWYYRHREEFLAKRRAKYRDDPEYHAHRDGIQRSATSRAPDREAARVRLKTAVYEGRVSKPTVCSICKVDFIERRRIHGHHPDYSKALEVVWVCARCHKTLPH